jgi:hypothetical protein
VSALRKPIVLVEPSLDDRDVLPGVEGILAAAAIVAALLACLLVMG